LGRGSCRTPSLCTPRCPSPCCAYRTPEKQSTEKKNLKIITNNPSTRANRSQEEGGARARGSYDAGNFEGVLPHLLLHVGALELDLVRNRRRGRRRGPSAHRLAVLGGGPEHRLRGARGPAPGLVGHSWGRMERSCQARFSLSRILQLFGRRRRGRGRAGLLVRVGAQSVDSLAEKTEEKVKLRAASVVVVWSLALVAVGLGLNPGRNT
jgi:hypothetical protein